MKTCLLLPLLGSSPRQAGVWSPLSQQPQGCMLSCVCVCVGGSDLGQGCISLQPKGPPMSSALALSHRRSGGVEEGMPQLARSVPGCLGPQPCPLRPCEGLCNDLTDRTGVCQGAVCEVISQPPSSWELRVLVSPFQPFSKEACTSRLRGREDRKEGCYPPNAV